jgi:ecotin
MRDRFDDGLGSEYILAGIRTPPRMHRPMKSLVCFSFSFLCWTGIVAAAFAQESQENMKAYPAPDAGMQRFVLHLPTQADEEAWQVELQVGQSVELDEANRYFFGGKIEEVSIPGWGFPKYEVKQLGPMAGTRIGVDPAAPKIRRFIRLGGEPYLIRYNSRLPIVVYVPQGAEVRYRLWKADPNPSAMNPG